MEMEFISRETITPSTPTPSHLRIYPLSFIDHILYRNYIPSLFFYRSHEVGQEFDPETKIGELKKSLSQVLSRYYPFAGRFRDQLSIECNDQGVLFIVTRITGTKLSTIIQNPTETMLNPLFPDELQWKAMSPCGSIVAIQITCFAACKGMVISVCMSHKVGDAATIFNFVNDWATMNREKEGELLLPFSFLDGGVSVFPQGDLTVFPEMMFLKSKTVVCRRFVFLASKIESLKAMVSSHEVQNPTRAQIVTAWIHKCVVSTLGLNLNTTLLHIPVNLRNKMIPPLPANCVGNMTWGYYVFNPIVDKMERVLPELVRKLKQEFSKFCDVYPNKFKGNNKDLLLITECLKHASSIGQPLKKAFSTPKLCSSDHKEKEILFTYSILCRFPVYESDFGWGKPIWVTIAGTPVMNTVILMDSRDGKGIEGVVSMEEKDMVRFEHNAEFLQFAYLSPNPMARL